MFTSLLYHDFSAYGCVHMTGVHDSCGVTCVFRGF